LERKRADVAKQRRGNFMIIKENIRFQIGEGREKPTPHEAKAIKKL